MISQSAAKSPCAADPSVSGSRFRPSTFAYWHLLSFDAPTVAVLWTIFTAILTGTWLPAATPLAMALGVWILYVSDRLLDARKVPTHGPLPSNDDLQMRHLFHHHYRPTFVAATAIAAIALLALLPFLPLSALRLYLVEGVILGGYFALIHGFPAISLVCSTHKLPKEFFVGPFFSAATFIPTVSRRPELRHDLLYPAILFAVLCSLNCLYIHAWEHPSSPTSAWPITHCIRHLTLLNSFFLVACLFCFSGHRGVAPFPAILRLYPLACAASALLLLGIHASRNRLSPLHLRVSADAALLTPLLFLPFLAHG